MPAIARGQENTTAILNWFITVNGTLTDAFYVGCQIWDISGGLPGTVVWPVPGDDSQWEDVTSAPGRFSVGSYYAYDSGEGKGYTPPLTEPIGTHRIKWQWKITGAAPAQMDMEDFEVLVQSGGGSADTYISIQDVRDEGITVAMADDAKVLAYIETWQAFLERACRQWFNPRALILSIDGTDSDALHFGVPIIDIDYIKLNSSPDELSTDLYKVYKSRSYPDDRRNPRIKLVQAEDADNFYQRVSIGSSTRKFLKGRQNQEIKGTFGYVEEDGTTPKLIKRALLKLVVEKLGAKIGPGVNPITLPPALSNIMEEKTDGHSIKYDTAETVPVRPGLSGITADQEILDIIKLYKAPLGVATPAHRSLG